MIAPTITQVAFAQSPSAQKPTYLDQSLPFDARVNDLVGRMTLEEKVSQMKDDAPAIARLGIPAYNWWNEGAARRRARRPRHGVSAGHRPRRDVGRQPRSSASPPSISDEARAKYHEYIRQQQPRPLPGAHVLVAEHQHLPRSALGPRPGDLRRGSVPHRPRSACRSSAGCRATTRSTSRPSRRRSTSPCTAGPSPSATASTRS